MEFVNTLFSPLYGVSSEGVVRNNKTGKIKTPATDVSGYYTVGLFSAVSRKTVTKRIHHLVAEAFLGPRTKELEINHKNGVKTDNRATNLEYCSHGDNVRHAQALGLIRQKRGETHWCHKLTENDIIRIRSLEFKTCTEAATFFRVNKTTISKIRRGLLWST